MTGMELILTMQGEATTKLHREAKWQAGHLARQLQADGGQEGQKIKGSED